MDSALQSPISRSYIPQGLRNRRSAWDYRKDRSPERRAGILKHGHVVNMDHARLDPRRDFLGMLNSPKTAAARPNPVSFATRIASSSSL